MFTEVSIDNFKSIQEAHSIKLRPLTVLVGANGSGKSNLVKALSFVSRLCGDGFIHAITAYGGFTGIAPKAYSPAQARSSRVRIQTRLAVAPPPNYPATLEKLTAQHDIIIGSSRTQEARVVSESVLLRGVLDLERYRSVPDGSDEPEQSLPSCVKVFREGRKSPAVSWEPAIEEHADRYLTWLGFRRPRSDQDYPIADVLGSLLRRLTPSNDDLSYETLLAGGTLLPLRYSEHYRQFRYALRSIRRFDLLLGTLREPQNPSSETYLLGDGANLPQRIGELKRNAAAWGRISDTLSRICPHVEDASRRALKTGLNYLEFAEAKAKRRVESWETSDGTLRAFAILAALESQPGHSTVMIEEPEQNLHPWAIHAIMDHIRVVIEERDIQVILTTHSPQVLEKAHPDEVLVASRSASSGTHFETLDEILPDADLRMGEVADLWVSGLLRGVPSTE